MKRIAAALALSALVAVPLFPSVAETPGVVNPILPGFFPDPSICRVGEDYYLVNSTFAYFPGIPVFHSRDLVHWEQIGSVLDRPEQLQLDGLGVSEGIFAPAIRFHRGVFYVTCTVVGGGGNFVVTATVPSGPWSNPHWLPSVEGIDPSLFFDDDDKAYIVYNSDAPDRKPQYSGHRTIRIREFFPASCTVGKEESILVNGGTDIAKKPIWIEGPHVFRRNGWYFLMAAEGGTAEDHSEVVFRSKNVYGPYTPYDRNPILTQRTLDPHRPFPVTCTGHADLVETPGGSWWAVFLGCRPYPPVEENWFNTGRETFLAPVSWETDWPVINPGNATVQYTYPAPLPPQPLGQVQAGNYTQEDAFNGPVLDRAWLYLRTPHESWWSLSERPGFLTMALRPESCGEKKNLSFLARRQRHAACEASTAMQFVPQAPGDRAGLLVFQNDRHFYLLCKGLVADSEAVQLWASTDSGMGLLASAMLGAAGGRNLLQLKVEAEGRFYRFSWAGPAGAWQVLRDGVDGTVLSTRQAGGFVGTMIGPYATSSGVVSRNAAAFDWFRYRGNDKVYHVPTGQE